MAATWSRGKRLDDNALVVSVREKLSDYFLFSFTHFWLIPITDFSIPTAIFDNGVYPLCSNGGKKFTRVRSWAKQDFWPIYWAFIPSSLTSRQSRWVKHNSSQCYPLKVTRILTGILSCIGIATLQINSFLLDSPETKIWPSKFLQTLLRTEKPSACKESTPTSQVQGHNKPSKM